MNSPSERTRTVSDIHDETGVPRDGSGQKIRDRLRKNEFGTGWEKRGGQYFMDEETFRKACRRLPRRSLRI